MFKIVLLALLATPNPRYLELSDGYAVRTSDINTIAKSFCANSSVIRSERWRWVQPQVAKLIQPQIERRVGLKLDAETIATRTRQDQLKIIEAIGKATDKLCP
jgi:hypothetical protein